VTAVPLLLHESEALLKNKNATALNFKIQPQKREFLIFKCTTEVTL
jgi:hypothetical protein